MSRERSRGKSGRGGKPSGARKLKERVKTARGRKLSSTRWLDRQLNDPYVAEARRLGYHSRAAFKLLEIDDRHELLKPGMIVVDLGAAPGGWSQVAAERVRSAQGQGRVFAIDLNVMETIAGVDTAVLDFMAPDADAEILNMLDGLRADLVLSDMAAPATGHKGTDHLKIMALCAAALEFARSILTPGGAFLCKVLQGGTEHALLDEMKRDFASVKHVKPPASRKDSSELYVLAEGFRGGGED